MPNLPPKMIININFEVPEYFRESCILRVELQKDDIIYHANPYDIIVNGVYSERDFQYKKD